MRGSISTPEKLRASWKVENGYFERRIAWFLGQICPAKPGGTELILKNCEAMLDLFADVIFSEVTLWAYDQGGCTCAECAPWGAKSYLTLAPKVAEVWKRRFPEGRIEIDVESGQRHHARRLPLLGGAFRGRQQGDLFPVLLGRPIRRRTLACESYRLSIGSFQEFI